MNQSRINDTTAYYRSWGVKGQYKIVNCPSFVTTVRENADAIGLLFLKGFLYNIMLQFLETFDTKKCIFLGRK